MDDAPRTTTPAGDDAAASDAPGRWAWRRRRGARPVAFGGLVVAVLVVAGCSASPSTPPAASSSAPPPPAASSSAPARAAARGVRGTITAENGSTWTVAARNGKQYTVTLSPSTQYGTKAAPASAAQFPVGAQVSVTGTVSGTTVTADRVAVPRQPVPGAAGATRAPVPA